MPNIKYFFNPRSIAIVGASSNTAKGGYRMLKNVCNTFNGPIYAVNSKGGTMLGLEAYRSLSHIPDDDIDLVLSFVPNVATPQVAREAVAKGCKAFLIQSGGFADSGGGGKHLQDEIVEIAKASPQGMRVWGPNCGGLIKANPAFSNSFIMVSEPLTNERGAAFISQSGMLAGAVYMEMVQTGQPAIASTSTIGNRADVDECDILDYLKDDPNTDCISLYLESIKNGRRFIDIVREITRTKPVVALVPGRSEAAAGAALSHTGSLLNDDRVKDSIFRQFGVTRVDDFRQFLEVTKAFTLMRDRPLRGNRIAVISHTGAGAVVASDALGANGFELAEFSDETKRKIASIMPSWAVPGNPADIWSSIEQVGLDKAHHVFFEALLADPGVDGVIILPLIFDYFRDHDFEAFRQVIAKSEKPIVGRFFGESNEFDHWRHEYEKNGGVAMYDSTIAAVRALAALRDMQVYREAAVSVPGAGATAVKALADVEQMVAGIRRTGRATPNEQEAKELLRAFGISVPRETLARDAEEAGAAADAIGYPVVVKICSPDIPHKTELGGVRTGLASAAEVREAVADMQERIAARHPDFRIDGYLVAEGIDSGIEVMVGARIDADFGPVVTFGLGGVFAEVLDDIVMRAAPVSRADAESMISESKAGVLLKGVRGKPRMDVAAAADVLVKLSNLVIAVQDDLLELDINPLIVLPQGRGAWAVDALMAFRT